MASFLKQTIKYPKFTGAIIPSSDNLAKLIVDHARLETANFVVELGPGTGVFTEYILKDLPTGKFFTIEINPEFVALMKNRFPETTTYEDSAENILNLLQRHGRQQCDRIISGLPWANFNADLREQLLTKIYQSLEPGGLFLTFAYSPFNHFKNGKIFKQELEVKFNKVYKTQSVPNIPRAFVYVCTK